MATQVQNAPTAKEIAERKNERLRMWTAGLGLLTAVFALLTSIFVKKTDTATTKVDTSAEQVRVLASKNAALQADNAEKDAKIQRLEADLAAAPTNSSSSAGTAPPAVTDSPAVFHKGPLTLKNSVTANLDAPQEATQWDINGTSGYDIEVYQGSLIIQVNQMALIVQESASYSACKSGTALQ